jgi:hypothetical protein
MGSQPEADSQPSRAPTGELMLSANPSMGPLSHDEWIQVHLRHAELHLSFLVFQR